MNKIYRLLILTVLSVGTFSCKQEDIPTFSGEVAVNFREPNGEGWSDGTNFLMSVVDLFYYYGEQKTLDITYPDLELSLLLEGPVQDKPIRVKLKMEKMEGFELPTVNLPEEVVIPAGERSVTFKAPIARPGKLDEKYYGKVTIDYEHSDVVPGTRERQSFLVGIQDFAQLSEDVSGDMTWEEFLEIFEGRLGKYGPMKLRLLLTFDDGYSSVFTRAYYSKIGYDGYGYGLQDFLPYYREVLDAYNAAHPDAPLTEPDGTLVTLPEPADEPAEEPAGE